MDEGYGLVQPLLVDGQIFALFFHDGSQIATIDADFFRQNGDAVDGFCFPLGDVPLVLLDGGTDVVLLVVCQVVDQVVDVQTWWDVCYSYLHIRVNNKLFFCTWGACPE